MKASPRVLRSRRQRAASGDGRDSDEAAEAVPVRGSGSGGSARRAARRAESAAERAARALRESVGDVALDSETQDSATDVTEDETDKVAVDPKVPTLLVNQNAGKKWASWWRRFWMTLLMIGGFFAWLFLARQTGIVILVLCMQAFIYTELTSIAIRADKEAQLPGFAFFYYYWFLVTVFFIYGRTLMPHIRYHDTSKRFSWVLDHHSAITYWLYIVGIMAFVGSLKKRKLYRYQFKQFAYCHVALLVVVVQSTYLAANVFNGLIWFVLPCSMVVCNDCTAYIFGFFFGRTPLIKLSPKKTWEGFLGGFLSTLVWAFWFSSLLQSYSFFTCPKLGFALDMTACAATHPDYVGLYSLTPLQAYLPGVDLPAWLDGITFSPLQIHAVVMAVFASLVAPFGGFFASGFKRAFKIKDFGDSIPGHGGFTDRMDCQIVIGLFTYMYYHSLVAYGGYAVESIMSKITSMPSEQQLEVFNELAKHLGIDTTAA